MNSKNISIIGRVALVIRRSRRTDETNLVLLWTYHTIIYSSKHQTLTKLASSLHLHYNCVTQQLPSQGNQRSYKHLIDKISHRIVVAESRHAVGLHVFRGDLVVPLHIVLPLSFVHLFLLPRGLLKKRKPSFSTINKESTKKERAKVE